MGYIGQIDRQAFQLLVSDQDKEEYQADERGNEQE